MKENTMYLNQINTSKWHSRQTSIFQKTSNTHFPVMQCFNIPLPDSNVCQSCHLLFANLHSNRGDVKCWIWCFNWYWCKISVVGGCAFSFPWKRQQIHTGNFDLGYAAHSRWFQWTSCWL